MPTNRIDLTDASWSDLGSGPMHLYLGQLQNVRLHIGTEAPGLETSAYVPLGGPVGRDYQGSERVFVRADNGSAAIIVITGGA